MFKYAVIADLLQREKPKTFNLSLPVYALDSKGACKRDIVIQWIVSQSSQFKHSMKTLELAVVYIDSYLNCFNIGHHYLELLAITAYSMAAKFNEAEIYAQIKIHNPLGQAVFSDQEYDEMEIQILEAIKYQLNYITPSDYIIEMNIPLDESIQSLLLFVLLDFEIYQHSHMELAMAIVHFSSHIQDHFTEKVKIVSSQLYSKILKAQEEQIEKSESEDTMSEKQSPIISKKKISKTKDSNKKLQQKTQKQQ